MQPARAGVIPRLISCIEYTCLPARLPVQEYNREAPLPAASPRMTRAQRRKSMAAPGGRSRQLEAAHEEEEQEEQQAQPQLPQQKKAAVNRRKSMAVTEQVGAGRSMRQL